MKIEKNLKGITFEKGYEILREKGAALVPLCPGNGHFNAKTIGELIKISLENFSTVVLFIPDVPTKYTYKAMGYDDEKSERKARYQGKRLRNRAKRFIEEMSEAGFTAPKVLGWDEDIASQETYRVELERLNELYLENPEFKKLVQGETRAVIQDRLKEGALLEEGIGVGTPYVLMELAWLTACPKILDVKSISYVYHNEWFLKDYIAGKYDGMKKDNLGYVIIK